ncbi:desi1 [Symbiodinium microadriaticum]|nr:desi1 [Symbiodinium microadriaticum]
MFDHLTELLNAINAHDDVSYWNILGDNFYDQKGDNTGAFFNALSRQSKSKVFGSVPGNHDFWINASPKLWTKKDQLGSGFMQFYAQDVAASEADPTIPYDFSADPDSADTSAENLPPLDNYFYFNQVGNVAFIGYSGAHDYSETEVYFEAACNWAASTAGIDTILLLGHWNSDGDGCDADMTVPEVYKAIAALPACQPLAPKIRYMLGHAHCNLIVEEDVGFMVGGMGMSDIKCGGTFGIPVVDTIGGMFKVYYFPVQQAWPAATLHQYDEVLSCIREHVVSGCYHLATEWTTVALA